MRPGNYVFFDRTQIGLGAASLDTCALSVIATVVSRPAADRIVFDAGSKTLTTDAVRGFGAPIGYGSVFADLDVGIALAEVNPLRQLEIGARMLRKLHERSEVVVEVLRTGAGADPALARAWRRWRDRHLHAARAVAQSLRLQGALRDGIDIDAATDVLYTIGGPETFRQLVHDRRWTVRRYERWLAEAGERLLL